MIISAFSTFTNTYLYPQVDPKMLKLTMEQAREVRMCICMFSGDGIVSPHCPSNYCVLQYPKCMNSCTSPVG